MRTILALGVVLALSGCVTGPGLQSRLAAYIGAPEATLVKDFGVPARQINVDGVKYLAYQMTYQAQTISTGPYWGPVWGPGFVTQPMPQNVQVWSCEATFAVVKDRVQSFTLRGNDCS
ncbi:hypothetical protein [Acidocella aminolytica]|jgi:hypothetical protein|uniref:Lipoprotein n=1 Tax=Acidocella aminolytica 101 = DSM 11237 TaxID=1120923 RepID=A0A0D6PGD6_9PROT|nr:hypothetical protein [Acidocella aminolytica]GAN80263.1 hypothetical protein Aam_041_030 [Acidocella aminolytica 101 = DSM 11237]GBQ44685.1 hypothetical protein AA11237_3564 [Acidocella aminolytica 101 = DSM 11237]SHE92887.1 hypothetical protein SAMN02746095_01607 [Acidocella aminolytica 101 = DSM 11237]